MARHTFVTASHTTYDEKKTVEILSRMEVSTIASKVVEEAAADIYSEIRALRDAAFSSKEQINGPRPEGQWTIWQCIEDHRKRLDVFAGRLDAIQTDASEAFRTVIDETLRPVFQYGLEQAIKKVVAVEDENKTLKEELVALRKEIDELKAKINP